MTTSATAISRRSSLSPTLFQLTQKNQRRIKTMESVRMAALGVEKEFQIVGSAESNPLENRISNESPVGAGLIGHKVGETVEIQTPGGVQPFEILAIGK